MSMTAIEFENISKQYRLGLVSTRTLSHDLNRWWTVNVRGKEDPYLKIGETNDRAHKGESDYVWALKDINFKVEQGDVVGIIGKNGAGKSTLLKLLSKVTAPTTGTIKARGRIGSLLEVGTGFHPEMTGRENIYMNGAILGMSKQEITRKLDEIVDFSGCERYLDTPVKRYSSGMMVRLGFAVAAHLDPEILVVDEVLAVGDAEFQKKAIGKMQDVSKGEGRTVLFVSHNMGSIRQLCTRGVVLANGMVDYEGDIESSIARYLRVGVDAHCSLVECMKVNDSRLSISEFSINEFSDTPLVFKYHMSALDIMIKGYSSSEFNISLEFQIYDSNQILLASFCPFHSDGELIDLHPGHFEIVKSVHLPKHVTSGRYFLKVQLTEPNISYLAYSAHPIVLDVEDVVGSTGLPIEYKERGFIVL